ncbi:hypothetical protein [Streptomyces rimosus]
MSDPKNTPELQFSPAAKVALHEIAKDFSDELAWRAAAIANKGAEGPTVVSVLDVSAALEQRSANYNLLRRRARLVFTITNFYGVVAFILLAIHVIMNGRGEGPLAIVAAVMLGGSTPGVTFWLLGRIRGENRRLLGRRGGKATGDEVYDYMRLWISLESAVRAMYSEKFGESRATSSLASMLRDLRERGVIDSGTSEKLEKMRALRNSMVHGEEVSIPSDQLTALKQDGRVILSQLSNAPTPS